MPSWSLNINMNKIISSQKDPAAIEIERNYLKQVDPILAKIVEKYPHFNPRQWLQDLPKMDSFNCLIFQVIGQQLSVQATHVIFRRLQEIFHGKLPTPIQVLSIPPDMLRASGLSTRKVATLRTIANHFVDGRFSDKFFQRLSDEEIMTKLTALPGIGPWTVHGFLIIALNRPDVVLPGDLALRKSIQRVYKLASLPTPDEVLQIAEPWRPYRSLATAYLFQTAFDKYK